LKLKNSSKNLSNVDIFVELKQSQRRLKEALLIAEQLRSEVQRLGEQLGKGRLSKENVDTNNISPRSKIQELMEEKECLFGYIEELKK
jgi:hypothetical protein